MRGAADPSGIAPVDRTFQTETHDQVGTLTQLCQPIGTGTPIELPDEFQRRSLPRQPATDHSPRLTQIINADHYDGVVAMLRANHLPEFIHDRRQRTMQLVQHQGEQRWRDSFRGDRCGPQILLVPKSIAGVVQNDQVWIRNITLEFQFQCRIVGLRRVVWLVRARESAALNSTVR